MDNLNNPTKIAIPQIIIPPLDFPIVDNINPKTAKGIPNQFSHPKRGIRPMIINISDRIPKMRPIDFMGFFL